MNDVSQPKDYFDILTGDQSKEINHVYQAHLFDSFWKRTGCKSDFNQKLGQLKKRGITRRQLAENIGIHYTTLDEESWPRSGTPAWQIIELFQGLGAQFLPKRVENCCLILSLDAISGAVKHLAEIDNLPEPLGGNDYSAIDIQRTLLVLCTLLETAPEYDDHALKSKVLNPLQLICLRIKSNKESIFRNFNLYCRCIGLPTSDDFHAFDKYFVETSEYVPAFSAVLCCLKRDASVFLSFTNESRA